ncbi:hypothetical protein CUU62_05425 [Pseudomonas sp. WP001]|nr:hypothetical protein CUU62_05425 [Pseudomonas sp. WP001]
MKAALASQVSYRDWQQQPTTQKIEANKGIGMARSRLGALLDRPLYDLDRLDLSATSTLQGDLQEQVTAYLKRLADRLRPTDRAVRRTPAHPLPARRRCATASPCSSALPTAPAVRVQTDNTDQPFDINEGSKLELGSTAKLRVLTTYLQIIAELHERYVNVAPAALRKVQIAEQDRLSRWAVDYLLQNPANPWRRCSTPPLTAPIPPAPANAFSPAAACTASTTFATKTTAATDPARRPA